ncbi:Uncharacterized protein HZ326_18476 [Fusarium oxysporum f. sp. albedinis]|nr:Uncharacterized protein HZ326_18476 [Fusarium oxysporum f. sp. albedinis]
MLKTVSNAMALITASIRAILFYSRIDSLNWATKNTRTKPVGTSCAISEIEWSPGSDRLYPREEENLQQRTKNYTRKVFVFPHHIPDRVATSTRSRYQHPPSHSPLL